MRNRYFSLTAVLLGLATLSLTTATVAQEKADSTYGLRPGSWSIQFQFSRNLTLTSFDGTLISAKRHFSAKRALRLGLSYSGNISDQDQETAATGDTEPMTTRSDLNSNQHAATIRLQYLFYSAPSNKLTRFIGFGPVLNYGRGSSSSKPGSPFDNNSSSESVQTGWNVGVNAVLGVEWFARENISVLAEYGVDLAYDRLKTTSEFTRATGVDTRVVRRRSFRITPNAVKFGLSVYL